MEVREDESLAGVLFKLRSFGRYGSRNFRAGFSLFLGRWNQGRRSSRESLLAREAFDTVLEAGESERGGIAFYQMTIG